RYDNVQVAERLAQVADKLGLDKSQVADLAREIIGGDGPRYTTVGSEDGSGDYAQYLQYAVVIAQFRDLIIFVPPTTTVAEAETRGLTLQRISDGWGSLNLDRYLINITKLPRHPQAHVDFTEAGFFEYVRKNLATFLQPFPRTLHTESLAPWSTADQTSWNTDTPVGSVMEFTIDIPMSPDVIAPVAPERGLVLCTEHSSEPGRDHHWNFSTVDGPLPAGYHPVSGTRQFGLRTVNDGWYFYTRAADRLGGFLEWSQSDS
ncbi:MAG: hypothetical protein M3290_13785, partial [Actinomycetota bacterium]|nr:hypothetical protein [Actinomycetota bacterium]